MVPSDAPLSAAMMSAYLAGFCGQERKQGTEQQVVGVDQLLNNSAHESSESFVTSTGPTVATALRC